MGHRSGGNGRVKAELTCFDQSALIYSAREHLFWVFQFRVLLSFRRSMCGEMAGSDPVVTEAEPGSACRCSVGATGDGGRDRRGAFMLRLQQLESPACRKPLPVRYTLRRPPHLRLTHPSSQRSPGGSYFTHHYWVVLNLDTCHFFPERVHSHPWSKSCC